MERRHYNDTDVRTLLYYHMENKAMTLPIEEQKDYRTWYVEFVEAVMQHNYPVVSCSAKVLDNQLRRIEDNESIDCIVEKGGERD